MTVRHSSFVVSFLYTVIRSEIIEACPILVDIFSRVGNADHGLFVEVSSIQLWRRMYAIKVDNPAISDESWIERAKCGHSHGLAKITEFMTKFVIEHSDDGSIIEKLEEFEAARKVTRKLAGPLFKQLGEIPSHILKGPWLSAMLKAALVAHKNYVANGLFSPSDLSSRKISDLKADIQEALQIIEGARRYCAAHLIGTKMTQRESKKLIDELDSFSVE